MASSPSSEATVMASHMCSCRKLLDDDNKRSLIRLGIHEYIHAVFDEHFYQRIVILRIIKFTPAQRREKNKNEIIQVGVCPPLKQQLHNIFMAMLRCSACRSQALRLISRIWVRAGIEKLFHDPELRASAAESQLHHGPVQPRPSKESIPPHPPTRHLRRWQTEAT
ncbi:hypothetical protein FDENT_11910 [Fusarium denticulatum]|uniref:Uncharacterized protein n=1 Tax=Fusarium denticulatum TaxID=48507 RepID=A0A8H5TFR7_9HYPO|nr:hypothetical protein FDENT_11910 [Fusarium denticulatum]